MTKKLAAIAAVAAMAVPAAAATTTAQADPLPPCVRAAVQSGPGYAVYFVTYTIDHGRPPIIIGEPILAC